MGPDASGKLGADGSAAAATPAASASAASASGYPDLPGRIGDPGDQCLPGAAASASAAPGNVGRTRTLSPSRSPNPGLANEVPGEASCFARAFLFGRRARPVSGLIARRFPL